MDSETENNMNKFQKLKREVTNTLHEFSEKAKNATQEQLVNEI